MVVSKGKDEETRFFLLSQIQSLSKSVIVESISTLKLHYLDSFFARDGGDFFHSAARAEVRAHQKFLQI